MLCWCVWCVVLCCTWLCCVVFMCVVLCCAVLCRAVPCRAMLCCAVLCCAVLCCVVLCCDALCWIVCCDALYIYSWALLCFIMLLLCCVMLLHCVVIHCALSCRRPVLFYYLSCHVGIVSCRTTLRSEGEGEGVRCVMFLLCYVMFCFIVLYVYYVALCGLLSLELIFVVLSLSIPTAKMSCHSNQYTRYIPFQPQKVIQDCGQRHQQQQSNPVN